MVGIQPLLLGEGRDLGHIDHDVQLDEVLPHPDLGVVVDREVAERVRRCRRGQQARGRQRREGGEGQAPEEQPGAHDPEPPGS